MAAPKRRVKRSSSGRQGLVAGVGTKAWYQLPDWATAWLYEYSGWLVAGLALLLAPATLLALVLGVHALPLEFFGIPGTANDVGLAALALILTFVFLALAIRPLIAHRRRGWNWLLLAAGIHFLHSIVLAHAITGGVQFLIVVYLYYQVKSRYKVA
jgi:uncharacterized membrane protein YhaH (DUF805 family)